MPRAITSEQFWQLHKKLPPDIQDSLFAEETGDSLYNICERNNLTSEHGNIVVLTRNVLLGLLPPDEFQKNLQDELEIEKELAKKVAREIYRFIFYPIKSNLEEIYEMEIAPLAKTEEPPAVQKKLKEKPLKKPSEEDLYREGVEQ